MVCAISPPSPAVQWLSAGPGVGAPGEAHDDTAASIPASVVRPQPPCPSDSHEPGSHVVPELEPELPELELELLELELLELLELPSVLASSPREAPLLDELHAPNAAIETIETEPSATIENFF